MKVKDLISQLSELDQELTVYAYTELYDSEDGEPSHTVFEIEKAERCVAVRSHHRGRPQLMFSEKSEGATEFALITVTEDVWPD